MEVAPWTPLPILRLFTRTQMNRPTCHQDGKTWWSPWANSWSYLLSKSPIQELLLFSMTTFQKSFLKMNVQQINWFKILCCQGSARTLRNHLLTLIKYAWRERTKRLHLHYISWVMAPPYSHRNRYNGLMILLILKLKLNSRQLPSVILISQFLIKSLSAWQVIQTKKQLERETKPTLIGLSNQSVVVPLKSQRVAPKKMVSGALLTIVGICKGSIWMARVIIVHLSRSHQEIRSHALMPGVAIMRFSLEAASVLGVQLIKNQ